MTHSPAYKIRTTDQPEPVMGGGKTCFCVAVLAPAANAASIYFGSTEAQNFPIAPGESIYFQKGECDLREDWHIRGTAGDTYILQLLDVDTFQRQHAEGSL